MNPTIKRYLNDDSLTFSARLSAFDTYQGKKALVLEETWFYPEAGGQLGDRGVLIGPEGHALKIVDTQINEGMIYHLTQAESLPFPVGSLLHGEIDAGFRQDMTEQHTAQHLLSAAFFRRFGGKTRSSRLGSEDSTIDIELPEVTWEQLATVEDEVNQIIRENRTVQPLYPNEAELSQLPLRRSVKVTENIRILAIDHYDLTPCGGTHCHHTGQIGSLIITSMERYKGAFRIHFLAGGRAILHSRYMANTLRRITQTLGSAADEAPVILTQLREEISALKGQLGRWVAQEMNRMVDQALASQPDQTLLWVLLTPGTPGEPWTDQQRRSLANRLCQKRPVVAAIVAPAISDQPTSFVMETNTDLNLNQLMAATWRPLGARGGGKPQHVEGSLPANADPAEFLALLKQSIPS